MGCCLSVELSADTDLYLDQADVLHRVALPLVVCCRFRHGLNITEQQLGFVTLSLAMAHG